MTFNRLTALPSTSATCNTTIKDANEVIQIRNVFSTNNVDYFNITLTPSQTNSIGEYTISGSCFDQGSQKEFTFPILISPSGSDDNNIAQFILLGFGLLFSVGFLWFGFKKQDPTFAILGSFALFGVGLYTLLNGVAVYRNMLTEGISIITLGIAGYISVRTGMEMIDG